MAAAILLRRVRRVLGFVLLAPVAIDWWRGRRPSGLVRTLVLRVLDELSYGSGVWAEVLRSRDFRALRPELVEWPGRRTAEEGAPASQI